MSRPPIVAALSLAVAASASVLADDWPQWMGPQRDNEWREAGVIERFPDDGPRILWRTPIAFGFAGPAVAHGRVFVMDYVTDDNVRIGNFERSESSGTERFLCLDEKTGDLLWKREYPVTYTVSYPAGPRCTPVVDDGKVYGLGAEGELSCVDIASGDVVWSINLAQKYGGKSALWGYANHPLIDGPRLIVIAGGEGSHAVALNKNTGEEIWRTESSKERGYSPPTIIEAGGVRQLILVQPEDIVSVNPETGKEYWRETFNADNGCVIMSPVKVGDLLFVGSHMQKSVLLKLASDQPGAEIVWRDKGKDAISPVNSQPFAVDGVLYGLNQNGALRAIDLAAGKQLWETPQPLGERPLSSGTAMIVRHGDRFWMFTEAGELVIARMSPEGFEEIDRAKVIEPTNVSTGRDIVWSMPAFANRRAYIRNDKEIICVDLAADSVASN
jgi:outer membrane protein assembly factor BamB